jgi:DNA-binding GntR family transcriptional regulator
LVHHSLNTVTPNRTLRALRSSTLAEDAAVELRAAILDGRYAPREKLVEREVAAQLGVSNGAVREAFARLEAEGFVTRPPRRGAYVSELTIDALGDLTRVRIALEQLAIEFVIERWTSSTREQAQAVIDEMHQLQAGHGMMERLFELDRAFHRIFWEASRSDVLSGILDNLDSRLARYLREAAAAVTADELRDIGPLHQTWLDAVGSGDIEHAKTVAYQHVTSSSRSITDRLERAGGRREPTRRRLDDA